jgi:hypothetical protein
MTTLDRFDPFERRITEAIQEIAAERSPAYLDHILEATARSRQRPRWAFPERWIPVNRLVIAAAAAMLIVTIGTVLLVNLRGPQVGPAGPTPTPTAPLATPLVSGLGRGLGYPTTAPTEFRDASWIADVDVLQGLFHDRRIEITTAGDGQHLVVIYGQAEPQMTSQVVTGAAEYLSLVSLSPGSGCAAGDFGDYQLMPSGDGLSVTLSPRREDCATRRSLLSRIWTRSLDTPSHGGRGVVTAFQPFLAVTLPEASYSTDVGNESANISADSIGRTLMALKNPTGWTQPCSDTGGSKVQLAHTVDAFVRYIDTLPGFSLGQQESFKLDGHDAARIVVPSTKTPECQKGGPDNGRVIEWGTSTLSNQSFWMLAQGDTDVIYLVQVGSDLYLLQWLGDRVTSDEEMGVLTTAHFIDTLPTTP